MITLRKIKELLEKNPNLDLDLDLPILTNFDGDYLIFDDYEIHQHSGQGDPVNDNQLILFSSGL